jgi:hypothetical protein
MAVWCSLPRRPASPDISQIDDPSGLIARVVMFDCGTHGVDPAQEATDVITIAPILQLLKAQ